MPEGSGSKASGLSQADTLLAERESVSKLTKSLSLSVFHLHFCLYLSLSHYNIYIVPLPDAEIVAVLCLVPFLCLDVPFLGGSGAVTVLSMVVEEVLSLVVELVLSLLV